MGVNSLPLADSVAAAIRTQTLLRLSPARWPLGYPHCPAKMTTGRKKVERTKYARSRRSPQLEGTRPAGPTMGGGRLRLCSRPGMGKLQPTGRMRPARVYYAARRHVHVRKISEVLFQVFESQPVNFFHSSRTLSKTVNSYIRLIDFNWTLWSDCM